MDQLHAAIAAYLRGKRQTFTDQDEDMLPCCRHCGAPIDNDGGLYNLANMRDERECVTHYTPF